MVSEKCLLEQTKVETFQLVRTEPLRWAGSLSDVHVTLQAWIKVLPIIVPDCFGVIGCGEYVIP